MPTTTPALYKRYLAEEKAFERLKKQAESRVVRWRYWETPGWYWDPEYLVKYRIGKPERAPKATANYAYGYDDNDRVVVIQSSDLGDPGKIGGMDFLRYAGDKIAISHFIRGAIRNEKGIVIAIDFKYGGVLSDVFEATVSGNQIVRVEHWTGGDYPPWDWKTIAWESDRVSVVMHGMRGRKAHSQITYGEKGKVLEELDLTKPPKRKPLPRGVTMQSLAKEIRERLARTVVATVTKAKVKEPVYCLALNYDCEGNPLLLPELGIGLESERRALLKAGGRDAKLGIWEPEQFSLFAKERTALQFRDKQLDRACELFNRELDYKGSDEPARKLILQVAADLAKVDWAGKLNTTADFIVYAVDTYGNDLRKNLKLSVPPKQLAKLKEAKLL
jgi:hypothetical protein